MTSCSLARLKLSRSRLCVLLAAATLSLLAILSSIRQFGNLYESRRALLFSQSVLAELQSIRANVETLEAEANRYLLFGKTEALVPKARMRYEWQSSLARLDKLSIEKSARASVTRLRQLSGALLSYSPIESTKTIHALLDQMIRSSKQDLDSAGDRTEQATQNSLDCIALSVLFAIGSLIVSVVVLQFWKRERRLIQEQIQKAELKHRLLNDIISGAPIGISKFDSQMNIIESNQTFSLHTNFSAAEDSNIEVPNLSHVLDGSIVSMMKNSAFDKGESILFEGIKLSKGAISTKNLDIRCWPLREQNGVISEGLLISIDVSEKVRLAQLRDDVFATIAHDMKTPLLGMDTILGMFLQGDFGVFEEEQSSTIDKLKKSNLALLKLVRSLQEVYRFEEIGNQLQLEKTDLVEIVQESVSLMRPVAEQDNHQIVISAPMQIKLVADPLGVLRVINNLIDNALKYSLPDGRIELKLFSYLNCAVFEISNSCQYVPLDVRERLFQRFYQGIPARSYVSGSGLGLYLCSKIVAAHRGTIECLCPTDSEITFRLTFPLGESDADLGHFNSPDKVSSFALPNA